MKENVAAAGALVEVKEGVRNWKNVTGHKEKREKAFQII